MKFRGYKFNTDRKRYFLAQHNTHVGFGAPPAAGHPGCYKIIGASKRNRIFLKFIFL